MPCQWSWGRGECQQWLLPRGEPIVEAQEAARNLGMVTFNPSRFGRNGLLLRAQPLLPSGEVQTDMSFAVFIYDGKVVAKVQDAEDARAVSLRNGDTIMVYSHAIFSRDRQRPDSPAYAKEVVMTARYMSIDGLLGPAIKLRPPAGWPVHRFEKNWVPFLHNGILYLSYSLEPHVILRCDGAVRGVPDPNPPELVVCTQAYRSSNPEAWRPTEGLFRNLNQPRHAKGGRGGSPLILVPGLMGNTAFASAYLGIAHFHPPDFHKQAPSYWHFFYAVQTRPPFRVSAVSPPFRFVSSRRWTGRADRIQFAAGLQLLSRGRLAITYGISDMLAMQTSLTLSLVSKLLRGERPLSRIVEHCTVRQCNSTSGFPQSIVRGRRCDDESLCEGVFSNASLIRVRCLDEGHKAHIPTCDI